MEDEILEVTKKSISMRGTWNNQFSGEEPDLDGLKFSVKCSDGSTLKYASWNKFKENGGAYHISFRNTWDSFEGMQEIVFYLIDNPEIQLKKFVMVLRAPSRIEVLSQLIQYYSGDIINPKNFSYRVWNRDGSIGTPDFSNITVSPDIIPKDFIGDYNCTFTYTKNDISVYVDYKINVKEKIYTINAVPNEKGTSCFIIGGKEISSAIYRYSKDDSIKVRIKAISLVENHKFIKWSVIPSSIHIDDPHSPETTIEISEGCGSDIWIETSWDDNISDEYGNIYFIEDGTLTSVELHSDKVVIPDGVKAIADKVFLNAEIIDVVFPESLQTIGNEAFMNCINLTHLEIPKNVTSIGESAFCTCNSIKSVKFNQTKPFTLGNYCFISCASLKELDFLALKDNFKNCVFGDGIHKTVWVECRIRTVKITKGNFVSELGEIESSSPVTVRSPYLTEVSFKAPKETTVRARIIGTTSDGAPDTISRDMTLKNAYCKYFEKKGEDSFKLNSFSYRNDYDLRESLGIYLTSDNTCEFKVKSYGLGHSQFNYSFYIEDCSKYRFTTIGGDSFFHEGDIGEGFLNWNMAGFVNDVLYPNIKDENGNSIINRMIPLYDRRMF